MGSPRHGGGPLWTSKVGASLGTRSLMAHLPRHGGGPLWTSKVGDRLGARSLMAHLLKGAPLIPHLLNGPPLMLMLRKLNLTGLATRLLLDQALDKYRFPPSPGAKAVVHFQSREPLHRQCRIAVYEIIILCQ